MKEKIIDELNQIKHTALYQALKYNPENDMQPGSMTRHDDEINALLIRTLNVLIELTEELKR